MVFTVPVHIGQGPTRRAVLVAAAAAAVSGCSLLRDEPNRTPGDEGLDTVYADALALAARYTAAIDAAPSLGARLRPLLEAHQAHATALVQALGRSPSASPTAARTAPSSQPTAVLSALATAERAAADRAAKVCLAASLWRAPLLASIAACRASNAEALT
jgi:hypothetical protein